MAQKRTPLATHYLVTEPYLMTRGAALHFPAKQFGALVPDKDTVYGLVIDIPVDTRTLTTMVVYINGAVNLYFNNGGSYTGASQRYQPVVQAGRTLMGQIGHILPECTLTKKYPLPTGQPHTLYLLTKGGIYTRSISPIPDDLRAESQDIQMIYLLYQAVMREIRSAQLKDRAAMQAVKPEPAQNEQ